MFCIRFIRIFSSSPLHIKKGPVVQIQEIVVVLTENISAPIKNLVHAPQTSHTHRRPNSSINDIAKHL